MCDTESNVFGELDVKIVVCSTGGLEALRSWCCVSKEKPRLRFVWRKQKMKTSR